MGEYGESYRYEHLSDAGPGWRKDMRLNHGPIGEYKPIVSPGDLRQIREVYGDEVASHFQESITIETAPGTRLHEILAKAVGSDVGGYSIAPSPGRQHLHDCYCIHASAEMHAVLDRHADLLERPYRATGLTPIEVP